MARKPTGILETDFYDFLETAWSLSDRQLSRSISFLTDIQQRRATYGTCQAMADQKNEREEMPLRAFADQIREDKGRGTAILLQDLQKGLCHIRRLHIRWHESKRKKVGAF